VLHGLRKSAVALLLEVGGVKLPGNLERAKGFEPSTLSLGSCDEEGN